MKAEIRADGTLIIQAENDLEVFALSSWWRQRDKCWGWRGPEQALYTPPPPPRFLVEVVFPDGEVPPAGAVPSPTAPQTRGEDA